MKNEVRYVEGGGQRVHALYGGAEVRTPLEELMDAEDGTGYTGSWLGREVLEFCFADEQPWDWRFARGRLAALVVRVCPEELGEVGRDLREAMGWLRGKPMLARVPMDKLPLEEEELEVLLRWLCGSRRSRRLREGTMRLYFLALEILPDAMRTRQGKVMTLDYFAQAFGEGGRAARARWSWRAKNLLDGLPRMKWQREGDARGKKLKSEKLKAEMRGNVKWEKRTGKHDFEKCEKMVKVSTSSSNADAMARRRS